MDIARSRALQAVGGVAIAGGLLLGGASMPLGDYGCGAAFGSSPYIGDNTTDVVIACAEQRADRQEVAIGFLVLGTGAGLGAQVHLWSSRRPARAEDPVRPRR
ncbi:hypothetical protein [Modestobacter roseus]|uniref:Uncharacterized protein n=1 Tax=Modestobacter roseus TaxID=1181884 RepID=A0A562IUU4_9ACTN|nr:hypothetical protein [Modestobacter roseus]MQA33590.1 hypothetical protein [Modestobacter roseus]TWH74777.1 hypothetical protein JD78_03322 [Modestobacter roseus]